MTGRELKRLRLKRAAVLSRQRQQEETFRSDVNEPALNEDPGKAYNVLVQAIYQDINKENFFAAKDNESSSTEESAATSATTNSSSADQHQELTVTTVPASPIRFPNRDNQKVEVSMGRLSNSHRLEDESDTLAARESVNEKKSLANPSTLTSPTAQVKSVDDSKAKSTQSTDNDISKQRRSLEDRRRKRLRDKLNFFKFLRGKGHSHPEFHGCQETLEHSNDARQVADSPPDTNDVSSVNSSSSYDTYGFDTFGFASPNKSSKSRSTIEDAISISATSALTDTFDFILEHKPSHEAKEIQKRTLGNFRFTRRKYARRRTSRIADDEKSTTSMKKTASAEARRLRSLRLRLATIGRKKEPMRSLEEINQGKQEVHEEDAKQQQVKEQQRQKEQEHEEEVELLIQEVLQEKPSSRALLCRNSRQVAQVNDDEDQYIIPKSMSRLSIISELTFVSDKLLSKVDELNFNFGSQTSMACQSEIEYCIQMDCKELDPPSDTEDPSVYFDASMKTPPRYLLNPTLKDEFLKRPEYSNRSNLDDLSSIGQNGAEILNRKQNFLPQAIPRDNQVEHVPIDRPNQKDIMDKETKKKELHGIFGRIICLFDDMEENDDKSHGSTSFSRIWREETSNVEEAYENAAPGLSLSTVSIEEEDYASYFIEDTDEYIKDLEDYGKDARQIYSC